MKAWERSRAASANGIIWGDVGQNKLDCSADREVLQTNGFRFRKINSLIAFPKRLNTSRFGNAISELIFRKRNPFIAVFLDRASEFNIRIMNSLLHS